VLKPVDDTRMFEKMGQSLAETGVYDIFILGFPSDKIHNVPNIHLQPSRWFTRLGFRRLVIPLSIFRKVLIINPDVLIVTTHELLLAAVMVKMIRRTNILYDIRENFFRNILYLPSFPYPLRPFLAAYVRAKEVALAYFIDGFVLSESGYQAELPFTSRKCTVIENRVKRSSIQTRVSKDGDDTIHLLFSGTLAESTGVFNAINLAIRLHAHDPHVRLKIIGYSAMDETRHRIRSMIEGHDFIELIGGKRLIPHDEIMACIAQADFGIIAYPPNPSTQNTMPTKLYEYLGACLPVLLINHPPWVEKCERYQAAIPFDLDRLNAVLLLEKMRAGGFYAVLPGQETYWEPEAERLARVVDTLCTTNRHY
jgi:glycosyltransferase involved in cell wall biosynthesis